MSEQVIVGTVGRAHGLRGQVTVRPLTDNVEQRFAAGAVVTTDGRRLTVSGHSWLNGVMLVGFEGVADRTSAEALRGIQLIGGEPCQARHAVLHLTKADHPEKRVFRKLLRAT